MHAVNNQPALARLEAQLDQLESVIPSLQLRTLELQAWFEFLERGRKHDA
jgi:exonuclease VII small subunit